ncbi:MAG: CGLD27 family protein [Pleurocapsa sp.]
MKESIEVDFCPVPQEQQPIYEYEQLKDSWLFQWGTLELGKYIRKMVWVGFWSWIVAAPIANVSFSLTRYPLKFTISSILGACLLVSLVLLRIYLGWSYIGDRLNQDRIFYEESGWYDGQTWLKPTNMLNRDRLVFSYQIQPILRRLQKTFATSFALVILGSLTWLLLG